MTTPEQFYYTELANPPEPHHWSDLSDAEVDALWLQDVNHLTLAQKVVRRNMAQQAIAAFKRKNS